MMRAPIATTVMQPEPHLERLQGFSNDVIPRRRMVQAVGSSHCS